MDAITQTTLPSATLTGPIETTASKVTSDFEVFLKLLTAQMKFQDPINPIDSTDYATQLATFSGVEQAVKTNDLLRGIQQQMGVSGLSELASWVGKEARVAGLVPFDGAPVEFHYDVAAGADGARLVVQDLQGQVLRTMPVSHTEQSVFWDGGAQSGAALSHNTYHVVVESLLAGAVIGQSPVESYQQISEVRTNSAGNEVVFGNGATYLASNVLALRSPS